MLLNFPALILVAIFIFLVIVAVIVLAVAGVFRASVVEPDDKYLTSDT